MTRIHFLALAFGFACGSAHGEPGCAALPQLKTGQRYAAVVSDFHFGLGRSGVDAKDGVANKNAWNPKEDFRWSHALQGFLDAVSECTSNKVDLIVAGDMLEMWQPPSNVACKGKSDDVGCSVAEMREIAQFIVSQHKSDFEALAGC